MLTFGSGNTCGIDRANRCHAFTLVEVIVVVLILGILAAVAAPRLMNRGFEAEVESIIGQARAIEDAARLYYAERGVWPQDSHYGNCTAFAPYINPAAFHPSRPKSTIAVGWTWVRGSPTVAFISYYRAPPPTALWQAIDEKLDDGDLATGMIAAGANVFYYGVEK